jgi:hypothetical protein
MEELTTLNKKYLKTLLVSNSEETEDGYDSLNLPDFKGALNDYSTRTRHKHPLQRIPCVRDSKYFN